MLQKILTFKTPETVYTCIVTTRLYFTLLICKFLFDKMFTYTTSTFYVSGYN